MQVFFLQVSNFLIHPSGQDPAHAVFPEQVCGQCPRTDRFPGTLAVLCSSDGYYRIVLILYCLL